MYYLSYFIKCIMYIKDKLSVIELVFLKKIYKETCFFFCLFFCCFFCEVYFLRPNASCGKFVCFFGVFFFFSNISCGEGRFYVTRSELDFRCESGRKGDNRDPNWRYL